jgi:endogenous inhibitor of DNA gyrase (YacG/DUF329 family)
MSSLTVKTTNRAKETPITGRCPICGKPRNQGYRPFCSKRCADIDLNRWLSGAYVVPGNPEAAADGDLAVLNEKD